MIPVKRACLFLLRNLLWATLYLIFFFVSLEICFWWIDPKGVSIQMRQTLPGVKPEIQFEVNRFGFRSLSMSSREKPPGTFRIVALGASTTVQTNQETQDTWPGQLEKLLNETQIPGGPHFEVDAYAAGADNIRETMDFVTGRLFSFHPDLVILLLGGNDLTYKRRVPKVVSSFSLGEMLSKSRALSFWQRSYAYYNESRVGPILEWHSANLPNLRKRFQNLPAAPASISTDSSLDTFTRTEYQLLMTLKAHSIPVAVLSVPSLWKNEMRPEEAAASWITVNLPEPYRPAPALMAFELDRLNRKQAEMARAADAIFIPLDLRVPKTLEYFFDEVHFTDKGSHLVAHAIFPEISRLARRPRQGKRGENEP